ncbi:hypothetical protein WIS52_15405 [Pseudonocardia nematodicida]|uniref:Uncharacterized protein n=1 Tax=Pseudonocardia nematodicida TaxID=1206997 RepID=A0ABV1KC48_9PSEU
MTRTPSTSVISPGWTRSRRTTTTRGRERRPVPAPAGITSAGAPGGAHEALWTSAAEYPQSTAQGPAQW